MSRVCLSLVLLMSTLTVVSSSQPEVSTEQHARSRIAALNPLLNLNLRYRPGRSAAEVTQDEEEWERVTAAVRHEVTTFIEDAISPSETSQTIQSRLRAVLADHQPENDHDRPTARVATLRSGRSLVVNYMVVRPPHNHSSLVFGFLNVGGRFQLVATAGEEYDGHGIFTLELPSPVPGEMWLLAGGRAFTFNGSKHRFRVYSFDGNDFTTVWQPDDFFNADVKLAANGFTIIHHVREAAAFVTEEYGVSTGGIARIK